jgi:hypothetical protein
MSLFVPFPTSAIASNISQTSYVATIRIVNSGAAAYNVSVPLTLNTSYLVNGDYVASNLSNSAMRDNYGNDTAYNPAVVSNTTWMIFVPSIPANSSIDYALYMGGGINAQGNKAWFAGTTGGTTANSTSLHLGNNFSISQTGYLDTSYANAKNLTAKTGSLVCNVTGVGNITATVYGDKIQPNTNIGHSLTADTGSAQRFTAMPACTINNVAFMLYKSGSPTGNAHIIVRRATDNYLLGNITTLNVTTLTTTPTWYSFTGTPITINSTTPDVMVCLEYYGGDFSNFVRIARNDNLLANESWYYLRDGNWTESAGYDLTYNLTAAYQLPLSNVPSGYQTFTLTGNTSGTYLSAGNVQASSTFFIPNIPDTTSSWQFSSNNTWPYLQSQQIVVNGATVQDISWQNAAIWVDVSGYGNNMTPTFRTATTNANVSASLIDFRTNHEAVLTEWDLSSYTNPVKDIPSMPGGMYDPVAPTFPGAQIPNDVSNSAGIPTNLFWFLIPCLIMVSLGLLIHDKTKSLVAQAGVLAICILFTSLLHIWSLYVIVPYILMAGSFCLAGKVQNY